MTRKLTFLFIAVLFMSACKKDHGEAPDTEPPVIQLNSPSNHQTVGVNQNFAVTALVSDNKRVEEIHLEIINTTSNAFIAHEHFTADGPSYNLARSFALAAGTFQIKVEADDDSGNNAEAEVTVTVR